MKIPFYSNYIQARKDANIVNRNRIELEKELISARKDAAKSIMAMTTVNRSLSDELYGNGSSGYKIGAWNLPIERMRKMARIAYWDSSFARSIIDRWVQIVVGKGLSLESQPAWGMIPGNYSQEARQKIIDIIETRFNIWGKSKNIHHLKEFNLNKLSNLAFFYYLYDGEFFAIFRYTGAGRGKNPLTIELVAPELIKRTHSEVLKGNDEENGIEYDKNGVAVAYHVLNEKTGDSVRIPKYGSRSGRQFVYHNYNKKNERQRRGVPLLAGEISEITQLADYQNLEIQAAKINALFAIWIEPPEKSDGRATIGTGARKKSSQIVDTETGDIYDSKIERMAMNEGGLIIDELPAGHKVNSFDTKRPNVNFETFTNPVKRNIAAGSGMALSVADYNFNNQYSASMGELIILYHKVFEYRENVAADFLNVIFRMWLWGEVDNGKINLSGFNDEEIQDAWCNASWKGSSRPDIDPLKSMNANRLEMKEAIKTHQQVTSERGGGNYSDNVARLKIENDALADANKKLNEVEKTTFSNSKSETVSESTSHVEES